MPRGLFRRRRGERGPGFGAQRSCPLVPGDPVLFEQHARATFDDAPAAAALVSGGGERDGRFLRVNAAFADMLGRSADELDNCEIAAITHPADRELELAGAGHGGVRAVRKRYLHASGRPVCVEVRSREVRSETGRLAYLVNHIVDLDRHHAFQRAMEQAMRLRRDMVSTISHELRTPLTSVQGYLEMIAGEDFGELTDDQRKMIDIALRNAIRIEEFVADLLMLARLDAAELDPVRRVPVDLPSVVEAALAEMAPAGAEKGHDVVVRLPASVPVVLGDAAHLKRAIENLISNAVKYTPAGGRIRISVDASDEEVRVSVADTGSGIDAAEIPLLGNRFYRGADAHRRAVGGTGLGLAITKAIVDRHGGTLDISSVQGEGSTFAIVLPLPGSAQL